MALHLVQVLQQSVQLLCCWTRRSYYFKSDVYGGTYRALTKVFTRFGIEVDFVDTTHTDSIVQAIRPTTKMLFIETPSNPLLRVTDI